MLNSPNQLVDYARRPEVGRIPCEAAKFLIKSIRYLWVFLLRSLVPISASWLCVRCVGPFFPGSRSSNPSSVLHDERCREIYPVVAVGMRLVQLRFGGMWSIFPGARMIPPRTAESSSYDATAWAVPRPIERFGSPISKMKPLPDICMPFIYHILEYSLPKMLFPRKCVGRFSRTESKTDTWKINSNPMLTLFRTNDGPYSHL